MSKFIINKQDNSSEIQEITVNIYTPESSASSGQNISKDDIKVSGTKTFTINNKYSYEIAKTIDYNKLIKAIVYIGCKDKYISTLAILDKSLKANLNMVDKVLYQTIANLFVELVKDDIAIHNNYIYLRNEYGMLASLCKISDVNWVQIINPLLIKSISAASKKHLIEEITNQLNNQSDTEPTIQFLDSYIIDNKLYEGIYKGIVKWVIPYKALPYATTRKFTKIVPEIDETFNFITNNNVETHDYMFQLLGTMFMTNPESKAAYGAKMMNLYGASGSNGKSLSLGLIADTLNGLRVKNFPTQNNTAGISIMNLKDKNYTSVFINKIFVYDPDVTKSYLPETISDILKKYTAGDETTVEAKYENAIVVRPSLLMAIGSNERIKSSDKTGGLERRMSWFDIDKKFPYNINENPEHQEFFNKLFTEEASTYLFELILKGYIELIEIGSLIEPASVRESNEEMHHANNSAQEWAKDMELNDLLYKTVKEVYAAYIRDIEGDYSNNIASKQKAVSETNWWYAITKYHPEVKQLKLKLNSSMKDYGINEVSSFLPLSSDTSTWLSQDKSAHYVKIIVKENDLSDSLKTIKNKSYEIFVDKMDKLADNND